MSGGALLLMVTLAAALAGMLCGGLGVFVVGLRLPFLAVGTAHFALAGAVLAQLAGLDTTVGSFLGACAGGALLGALVHRRSLDLNAALGVMFSLSMGIAFLGIGLLRGPRTPVLSLLWGNLLFITPTHVVMLSVLGLVLATVLWRWDRAVRLLLFDRELAGTLIPEGPLLAGVLLVAAAIISLNLHIVGGMLIYGLVSNPAVAALRLARSYRGALLWSTGLGAASAVLGFALAYALNLPAGACVVLVSAAFVGLAMLVGRRG